MLQPAALCVATGSDSGTAERWPSANGERSHHSSVHDRHRRAHRKGTAKDGDAYWDEALPEAAGERLLENWDALKFAEKDNPSIALTGATFGIYDELIIDEAQDVVRDCYLDVLDLSVRGGLCGGTWRMFGDFAWQTIYDDTVSLERFCESRGGNCPQIPLDENCRNTPRVAELACMAGSVTPGYSKILRPDDGVEPEVHYFADNDVQKERLIQVLEDLYKSGFTGPQVAVLSTHGDQRSAATSVADQPCGSSGTAHGGRRSLYPRQSPYRQDTLLQHYRFKGLESRAVVLTDVSDLSTPLKRSLVYVGATRATHRLIVLAHESLRRKMG